MKGSLTGISIGTVTNAGLVTPTQKLWRSLQALGAIAFAYSFSVILIEIQDTIGSPPAEYKTMKKATLFSICVTTLFYMLCGCFGYAAFGDNAPGNLLTGFVFTILIGYQTLPMWPSLSTSLARIRYFASHCLHLSRNGALESDQRATL